MAQGARNRIRIIGGRWRGRRLDFVPVSGLRPTPDRVRETLFNWLAPYVAGARCLDLFAGSGILGFEAVSRGAASAHLVENNDRAFAQLQQSAQLLGDEYFQLSKQDVLQFLKQPPATPYDIVFLDPPYGRGLLQPCYSLLLEQGWLQRGALLYLEQEQPLTEAELPAGLEIRKCKKAGQVHYHLLAHP